MLTLALALGLAIQTPPDTTPATDTAVTTIADTIPKRRHAITYSDAYNTRLTIHRIGSYTMIPLFVGEYALGQDLMNGTSSGWVKPTHSGVASAIGVLFAVNTVTGAMNFWESRQDPAGRTRRIIHTALMVASDAGMTATAILGGNANSPDSRSTHRTVALTTFGIATVGTAMMWLWKD